MTRTHFKTQNRRSCVRQNAVFFAVHPRSGDRGYSYPYQCQGLTTPARLHPCGACSNSMRHSIFPLPSSWPLLTQISLSSCQSSPLRWTANHGPATKWTPSSHKRVHKWLSPTRFTVPLVTSGGKPSVSIAKTCRRSSGTLTLWTQLRI